MKKRWDRKTLEEGFKDNYDATKLDKSEKEIEEKKSKNINRKIFLERSYKFWKSIDTPRKSLNYLYTYYIPKSNKISFQECNNKFSSLKKIKNKILLENFLII